MDNPEAYISVRQFFALMDECERHMPQNALGARYGMELDLSAHGLQAFSLLNGPGQAVMTWRALQFLNARLPLMGLRMVSQGQQALIQLRDLWPLGPHQHFIVEAYLGSMCRIASSLTRRYRVDMRPRYSPHRALYEEIFGCEVRMGQHSNALVVERQRRPRHARPPALAALPGLPEGTHQIVALIRQRIHQSPGRECTLERVAESLGSTTRTLSRYLNEAGLMFSDLRNHAREQLARQYLQSSDLTIADIAERLGYSDQASFTKAFRNWTGHPPGRLRRGED